MSETLLRFVHITDTHISADPHYNSAGAQHTPLIGAQALVHQLNTLPFTPDFVLHTGDVAADPNARHYHTAKAVLGEIKYPVYYIPGNHDDAGAMQRFLLGVEPKAVFDYQFEVNGVQVICMDSNRPAPPYRGRFSDEQLQWLSALCAAPDDHRPLIVALHHPVLPMGSPAWDTQMNLLDGEAFHRALLPARSRIRGVFSGHVHQNTDIVRDGIPYFTGLSSWYQIENYPDQTELVRETYSDPGFSVVLVTKDQLYVRRHTFIVDSGSLTD